VEIPSSVKNIEYGAFRDCTALTSVTLQNGLQSIEESAFQNCTSLTSVEIPSSVTRIGMRAFHGCTSLKSVEIPSSVTEIGHHAFPNKKKLTITIKIEEIGDDGSRLEEELIKLFPYITVEIDNSIYEDLLVSGFHEGKHTDHQGLIVNKEDIDDYENILANEVIKSYLLSSNKNPEDGYRKNKRKCKSMKRIRKSIRKSKSKKKTRNTIKSIKKRKSK
jgi:hypothetical protein